MNFKTITEGYTEIELSNGDRLRAKIVFGDVEDNGQGGYNLQHQIVSFVTPKDKVTKGKGMSQ